MKKLRFNLLFFAVAFVFLFVVALFSSYFAFTIEAEDSWYNFRLICYRIVQFVRLPSYPSIVRNFFSGLLQQLTFGSFTYAALITVFLSNLRVR